MHDRDHIDQLLTPGEVAKRAGVDPKTVARWAQTGKIPSIRTLGGHRRFRSSDIDRLFPGEPTPAPDSPLVAQP